MSGLSARLRPRFTVDEPLAHIIRYLRNEGASGNADIVNAFIVANNALKTEAADEIDRLTVRAIEAEENAKISRDFLAVEEKRHAEARALLVECGTAMTEAATFLDSIEGAGYGGMASFENARRGLHALLSRLKGEGQ